MGHLQMFCPKRKADGAAVDAKDRPDLTLVVRDADRAIELSGAKMGTL